jgi:hypothetical protein
MGGWVLVNKNGPLGSVPYVCPEPVLVKCSFLYINGSKRPFLLRHSPMGAPNFNQTMVIDAVDGLAARGIPTDLYVIDYFNWAKMGDYTFNPQMWPDPAGMVRKRSF